MEMFSCALLLQLIGWQQGAFTVPRAVKKGTKTTDKLCFRTRRAEPAALVFSCKSRRNLDSSRRDSSLLTRER